MADGPCKPWVLPADLPCTSDGSSAGTNQLALAADAASRLLYVWTGRRYAGAGACVSTARPASTRPCGCWPWTRPYDPWWSGSGWAGLGCACRPRQTITLPGYPVVDVLGVEVGGVALPADAYRLERRCELVRQDGGLWPSCQDDDAPLGAPGTWSVRYSHGADPPPDGVLAAQALACELSKALTNPGKCQLPSGVTRVVRQGVTIERVQAAFEKGGRVVTGLALVDSFVGTENPGGQRRRTAVLSPDRPYARRV
jgi:hypothetical protein